MGKKIVFGAIGLVVIVVAVAVALVVTRLDRMVGDAVETYGRAATGTDVNIGSVDIAFRAMRRSSPSCSWTARISTRSNGGTRRT